MPIKLQNTAKMGPRYGHWFIHGLTRSGKTIAAATFPRPVFLVPRQEGSHVSLTNQAIDFIEVDGPKDMDEALTFLESRHLQAQKAWQGDDASKAEGDQLFPWESVVVESITHYCDGIIEEYTRGGQTMMDKREWGKLSAHIRNIQARIRRLPVHGVFVALSKTLADKDGVVQSIEPAFPGAMQEKLPSACEVVVYMERKAAKPNDIFTAHFNRSGKAIAGSRYHQLTEKGQMRPFRFPEVEKLLGWV